MGQQRFVASAPPQVMGSGAAGAGGGFMTTLAPNGMQWMQYCQTSPPLTDNQGFVSGPWGECIAWANVFELQNPSWSQMPEYAADGPCGQVIDAMLNTGGSQQAAERLEQACE